MTTLIWEGDLFHDVNLISPAKFWIGASIPLDMFSDFWEIVVEPDEELKKKTKKRDAMKSACKNKNNTYYKESNVPLAKKVSLCKLQSSL